MNIGFAIVCSDDFSGNVTSMDGCKIVCFYGDMKKITMHDVDEQCAYDNYAALDEKRSELESQRTREILEKMGADGVKMIFCSGKIDVFCKNVFEEAGIAAVENVNESDLHHIVRMTGASNASLSFIENYKSKHVGFECKVVFDKMSDHDIICIKSKRRM